MEPSQGPHIGDEDLENYLLKRLPEAEAAAAEEHMLLCEACRQRLEETESYIRAMRSALSRVEREDVASEHSAPWQALWGVAAAAAAFLVVVLMWPRGVLTPISVALRASRGPAHSQAPAGRPLDLTMDLTEVSAFPSYRVELVDARGTRVWEGTAAVEQGRAAARVPAKLSAGQYYIRLYSPGRELLREYGLEAH